MGDADGGGNPWAAEERLLVVQLGDHRSGLVIARRCGFIGHKNEELQERVAQCSSVQLTKTLKLTSKLKQDLHEVETNLHQSLLDKESHDLMHVDILEERLKSVDMLLNHFTAVLASKESILGLLQSSSTGNSVQVEASFQKNLMDIVHSISPTLSELIMHTSDIQSAVSVDLTNVKEKMGSAVECLVECRDMYRICQQLHKQNSQ